MPTLNPRKENPSLEAKEECLLSIEVSKKKRGAGKKFKGISFLVGSFNPNGLK